MYLVGRWFLMEIDLSMYNGPSVKVTDCSFVTVVHDQRVALFLISFFDLKLGLYSVYLS